MTGILRAAGYEIYLSDNGSDFSRLVAMVKFAAQKCRFLKLKALSEINGGLRTSVAEVGVVSG